MQRHRINFRCLRLIYIYEKRRITSKEADDAVAAFTCLIRDLLPARRAEFCSFSKHTDRLDDFYAGLLGKEDSSPLFLVVRIILVLFHGNASVERGFKVNKDTCCSNMQEKSLQALRLTYDSLRHMSPEDATPPITNELMQHIKSSRQWYRFYLNEQQQQKAVANMAQVTKRKNEETADLEAK